MLRQLALSMAANVGSADGERATGFFCSTSGTYFTDKESLAEHYRSDFHRYNLKRKVAGLPPVTKEWFDARKAQLASAAASPTQRIWYDPLTRRKFMSEAKYREHVKSKKYAELVKRSGEPAPAPVVMLKRLDDAATAPAPSSTAAAAPTSSSAPAPKVSTGFTVKVPHRPLGAASSSVAATAGSDDTEEVEEGIVEEGGSEGEDSGWETASEEDEEVAGQAQQLAAATARLALGGSRAARATRAAVAAAVRGDGSGAAEAEGTSGSGGEEEGEEGDWEEWDVRRSLFDNRMAASMEENLEYMFKQYGFYLPDAEYLVDPEGLLKYLGSKLQYGKVPLCTRGDDANARQFRSLHAVQRHMVDANRCKMVYDDNEDEYADFYDYSSQYTEGAEGADGAAAAAGGGGALVATGGVRAEVTAAGLEMVVGGGEGGGGGKVLGSRWLSRYYKQRPRPAASRALALAAAGGGAAGVVAQYRALGVETRGPAAEAARRAQKAQQRGERQRLNLAVKANVLHNTPKNVPY